ncbi:hypothetical protein [Halorubrum lacusprofundi]|jgi:hypothetical protein|uniref:DUF8107 domain-containing protein n=1 Tax=Halorubrum lacusprofundi (strain ATCC 49239 / DSM 5036 / JCM 8891 / ACAM 34) TaxID=416348 RepID=B9LU93_HALLT|nr:hypothetical protein [Halorubrum lacusprofundi]ACM58287.1 conserved hypothetical protein [Halorubrum lacusprofundi ATCC 49239]MCG1006369.1 hypothetical protein [Halorubrum lacusprofundi]
MGEDQKGTSEDPKGIREGVEGSKGDLRVVLLLNAVLSGMFAWTAFWGLQLLDVAEVTATNVASLALIVFALTYVTVLR